MVYQRIKDVCKEHGTTITAMSKALNISPSSVANWKRGGVPRSDTLQKIADHFCVSTDELLSAPCERPVTSGIHFYDNLQQICQQKGITLSELCEGLGISADAPDRWGHGYPPNLETVRKIAIHLHVSVGELVGFRRNRSTGTEENPFVLNDMTQKENAVILAYRNNPEMQSAVDRLLGIDTEK